MQIASLIKTTLLDYPGFVAATIFLSGCNFRCPFCHNSDLVTGNINDSNLIDEEEILAFLRKRKNVLAGVCITGGEPTLQADLADFIRRVKELGYLVKLDTNGYKPEVLESLLIEGLLDYIAMDVKNCKGKYHLTCGFGNTQLENNIAANYSHKNFSICNIEKSVELIKNSGISHEFRTTVVKEFHTGEDLIEIGKWLSGSDWYLQLFEDNDKVLEKGYTSYSDTEINTICEVLQTREYTVKIRGA